MKAKLGVLVSRLEEITPLLNPVLQGDLRNALDGAEQSIGARHTIWLNEMERFCNGEFQSPESISKLRQITDSYYNGLKTSLSTLLEIQADLAKKM